MATPNGTVAVRADVLNSTLVLDVLAGRVDGKKLVIGAGEPSEVAARIERQDLEATSAEQLFGSSEMVAGKDFTDKPFRFERVEWQLSDIEGAGLPFYAVLHGVTYEGEVVVIGVGARSVVRKAAKADAEGWLPVWVKIVRGKKTAEGYYPLDLVAAPEPF